MTEQLLSGVRPAMLEVQIPAGRLVFAGEAVPGTAIVRDPVTGAWRQIPVEAPVAPWVALRRRFRIGVTVRTWGIAGSVVALGVVVGGGLAAVMMGRGEPGTHGAMASIPVEKARPAVAVSEVPQAYQPPPPAIEMPPFIVAPKETLPPPRATAQAPSLPVGPRPAAPPQPQANPAPTKAAAGVGEKEPPFVVNTTVPVARTAVADPPDAKGRGVVAPAKDDLKLLAIIDANRAVFTNPKTGLPVEVKVGASLPDGDVLKAIDRAKGAVSTGQGRSASLGP